MSYTFDNERSIYIQLAEQLRIKIISGDFKEGKKLPSVREFSLLTKVNPNTVQKALLELERERLVYTERTNGKFVTEDKELIKKVKERIAKEKINTFLKDMDNIGIKFSEIEKYLHELENRR